MIRSDKTRILKERGLKVTPQRIAVLEAFDRCRGGHPTAETIIERVRAISSHIATGTVYKILEAFVEHDIIKKVNTERDVMRYDLSTSQHHHLYSTNSDRIEDYYDEQLDRILNEYFEKRSIPGFKIEDLQLHIKGKFIKKTNY